MTDRISSVRKGENKVLAEQCRETRAQQVHHGKGSNRCDRFSGHDGPHVFFRRMWGWTPKRGELAEEMGTSGC